MYNIILNPAAGRGLGKSLYLPNLVEIFDKANLQYEILITTKQKDAYEFAKNICVHQPDSEGIIGIGGDGTMQEIVAGMVDANAHGKKIPVPLALFPGGTGNDFAMTIEGGKAAMRKKYEKDPKAGAKIFAEKLRRRNLRTIDLITANDEAYLVAGNIGIDARIVHNATALKSRYGGQAYLAAAYKSIMQHKNIPLEISLNNETIKKDVTLIAICNNSTYGGGLHIAPPAKYDDGKITLCIVNGMSRLKLGVLFPSLLIKKHVHLKDISFVECTELRLTLPPGTETLCLDGNLFPVEGEIYFKILPSVLDVFI
ncbi:MAG: hypothetical protein FWC32_09445 [Firmicutes bacterium]|nr:hypothetical protein [Bacillota bacterium]